MIKNTRKYNSMWCINWKMRASKKQLFFLKAIFFLKISVSIQSFFNMSTIKDLLSISFVCS